jgi:pilus assembly protein CpaB
MNRVQIIILVVAFIAAVGVALVVRNMVSTRNQPAPVAAAPPPAARPMARVLTAKVDLPVGTRLSAENMNWQDWPAESLNPGFITDGAAAQVRPASSVQRTAQQARQTAEDVISGNGAMQSIEGAIVRTALVRGETIIAAKFVRGGEGGFMSVVLGPGMRAMSVPVTVEASAGGFVLPGDRVDVLTSHPSRDQDQGFTAETVMRNVRVLAIDQTSQAAGGAQSLVGAVVTLEIPAADTEIMARAKAQGNVMLALRSYADLGGPSGRAGPSAIAGNNVRVFRAGQSSEVTVTS